jgi:hypothetical protein
LQEQPRTDWTLTERSTSEGNLQKRFWQRPLFFEAIAKREFQSKLLGLAGEYGIDHPTYSVESSPEW